jgi:hypothetical protein
MRREWFMARAIRIIIRLRGRVMDGDLAIIMGGATTAVKKSSERRGNSSRGMFRGFFLFI